MTETAAVAGAATVVSARLTRRHARRRGERARADAAPRRATPARRATGTDGLTAELQRLGALRQDGLVTDEECALAKAKLLGL